MNINYLKVTIAATAAMFFTGISAQAFDTVQADVRYMPGVITWIDLRLGQIQIKRDISPNMGEVSEFRINRDETRVTDPTDTKFFTIRDLHPGQHVVVDVIHGKEEKIVQKITADPRSFQVGYNETVVTTVSNETQVNEVQAREARGNEPRSNYRSDSLVGPRGPNGPAGTVGEQGFTGPQGVSGTALMGERGGEGPAGPMGEQGFTGPRGPSGDVARGPVGDVGPSGPRGEQGVSGQRGQQGDSLAGYAGPVGVAGPQGARGPVGDAGIVGPTTYGPSGPAGYAGSSGQRGTVGEEGSQGNTTAGVAGLAGPSGASGARGEAGAAGYQGAAGKVGYWAAYKEFNFSPNESSLNSADMQKASDIAAYMKDNPSLQIGIDGIAANSNNQGLNDRRVNAIREALINDGVSPGRISIGEMDERGNRRDGRIAVFFKTA